MSSTTQRVFATGLALGLLSAIGPLAIDLYLPAFPTMTRDLHEWFKGENGVTCCKILTAKGKGGCVGLTAGTAAKVAELILEKR